jgi:hypothetical protein
MPRVETYREFIPVQFQHHDANKIRWSLIPRDCIRDMVKVLEVGAKKYSHDNWKLASSDSDIQRLWDSFDRHRDALQIDNQYLDAESTLSHTSHMLCNLLFIHWQLKERHKNATRIN